ncbi:MAG: hypothetical protein Q8R55_01425 [Candidatus Taylorbacteria bacterium]|nr:hypothetical protein [Candidatus Taylorbacteria bacterium]
MSKVSIKKSFSHKLLKALAISGAVGGVVLLASLNPYFGIKAIGAINKELKRRKWREIQKNLYKFKQRGLAKVEPNNDGTYSVSLTKAGQKELIKYDLDTLKIKNNEGWDGIWRVFLFDIPARKKAARAVLLSKLKELGFVMLQRSVWVHPFPCRNELAVIAKAFGVEPYIRFHEAYDMSHEEKIKQDFEKRSGIVLKKI